MPDSPSASDLLRDLVAFPTVSRDPNRELLLYRRGLPRPAWRRLEILWNGERRKGNLWATIGPADRAARSCRVTATSSRSTARPGPATLHRPRQDGRLYGRGRPT